MNRKSKGPDITFPETPTLPKNFRPHVYIDEDLIELLEKIEISEPKEVASLTEWNNQSNLIQEYYNNKVLSKQLVFNKKMVFRLKADQGLACLLINFQEKEIHNVNMALRWAMYFKTPVVAVLGLSGIMKHKVGINIEMIGIRKSPSLPFLKNIVDKVVDFCIKNPYEYNPVVPKKAKKPKATKGAKSNNDTSDNLNEVQVNQEQNIVAQNTPTGNPIANKIKNNVPKDAITQFIHYQPRIVDADAQVIRKLILQLPYLHVGQAAAWDDLKGQTYPEIRSQLIVDVVPICFLLDRNKAGCVLISLDRFEKLHMNKLVHICAIQKVPVLVVPGLRPAFKSATALTTNCIAIFKYPTDPLLNAILNTVVIMQRRYQVPQAEQWKLQAIVDFGLPKQWPTILEVGAINIHRPMKRNKNKAKKIDNTTNQSGENETADAETAKPPEDVSMEETHEKKDGEVEKQAVGDNKNDVEKVDEIADEQLNKSSEEGNEINTEESLKPVESVVEELDKDNVEKPLKDGESIEKDVANKKNAVEPLSDVDPKESEEIKIDENAKPADDNVVQKELNDSLVKEQSKEENEKDKMEVANDVEDTVAENVEDKMEVTKDVEDNVAENIKDNMEVGEKTEDKMEVPENIEENVADKKEVVEKVEDKMEVAENVEEKMQEGDNEQSAINDNQEKNPNEIKEDKEETALAELSTK